MNQELLEALKKYLGTEKDIDFEKKVDQEETTKALELIAEHYQESFPEDLEKAVGVLAKCAAGSFAVKEKAADVEKAGAKFSKDALKKMQAIILAVEALKAIISTEKGSTEKADTSKEMAELTKQLTDLKESLAKAGLEKKDDATGGLAELTKALKDVSERIGVIEKSTPTKTSLTDQDDINDDNKPQGAGDGGKVLWPSLARQDNQA